MTQDTEVTNSDLHDSSIDMPLLAWCSPSSVLDIRILPTRKPTRKERDVIQEATGRHILSIDPFDEDCDKMAFALVDGQVTLCVYRHWFVAGGRYFRSRYGVEADFIALDGIASIHPTEHGLSLHGSRCGFVRHWDRFGGNLGSFESSDPLTGHALAKETRDWEYLVPVDLCEPSLLSILEAYLAERERRQDAEHEKASEEHDMTQSRFPVAPSPSNAPDVTRQRLERNREVESQVRDWNAKHPTPVQGHAQRRWRMFTSVTGVLTIGVPVAFMLAFVLFPDREDVFRWLMTGGIYMLIIMMVGILVLMPLGWRFAMRADEADRQADGILNYGEVTLVREEADWYLCVANHMGRSLFPSNKTDYYVIRLTDERLSVAYDRESRKVTFLTERNDDDGNTISYDSCIQEGKSHRRDALTEFVPSRDLTSESWHASESYSIADCFSPSIRMMIRTIGTARNQVD